MLNTAANLTFVQTDQQIQILWGSTSRLCGIATGIQEKFINITATVYNSVFELMKKQTITGKYSNVAASTILAAICAACGMTAGFARQQPLAHNSIQQTAIRQRSMLPIF